MTLLVAVLFAALTVSIDSVASAEGDTVARFVVELEVGPVWQSRNDVQVPNDADGTRFSMVDLQGKGPWPAGRIYLTWNINSRHGLRALAAPLSITETGLLSSETSFAGATFDAGTTEATYQFNSWRLTYTYRFYTGSRWAWWVGFTAKIRDAKVELNRFGMGAAKTDVGFVPLLHLKGWYRLPGRLRLTFDMDALAGGPGRAEDVAVKLHYDLDDRWSLSAGYRTVEGGADVDEVYNFAWFHYAVGSVSYRF